MIETAIVAPVLICMALGGFEVSNMVARQHDLQNGAADAEQIVQAAASGTATDVNTIKSVLANTLGIPQSNIDVNKVFRCGTTATLVSSPCSSGSYESTYVEVTFRDTYNPNWTSFGVGSPVNFRVDRLIQVSSEKVA
ncbi:MAG TPA: TadE/TadG family type IV pilus assembly protein [Croceibacterium sp.]|nr:TadE/TadG family type IV pilus assembly protein [Croceibacterium sp.]